MGNPIGQLDPEEYHREITQEAFDRALEYNDFGDLRLLADGGQIDERDKNKFLALAVIQSNLELVELLMESCAEVDPGNPNVHLLHQAIRNPDPDIRWNMVRLLIKPGVSIEDEGEMLVRLSTGMIDIKGGSYPSSCVHEAVYQGDIELVKFLVIAGSRVDFVDHEGYTPLHVAIQLLDGQVRINMVEQLIKFGADVNIVGPCGTTCMHFLSQRQVEACPLGGIEFNTYQSDADLVKIFFEAGARIDVMDQSGFTPLHLAIKLLDGGACIKMVKQLLEAGADPNIRGPRGLTPLDLVTRKKSGISELITLLVGAGAQLDSVPEEDSPIFGSDFLDGDFDDMNEQVMYADAVINVPGSSTEFSSSKPY